MTEKAIQLQLLPGITDAGNLTTTPYSLLNISPITSRLYNKEGMLYPQAYKARSGPKYTEKMVLKGQTVEMENQIKMEPGNTGFLTKREAEVYTMIEKLIRDDVYAGETIVVTAYKICDHLNWVKSGKSYKTIDNAIEKLTKFRMEHTIKIEDKVLKYRFSMFPEDIAFTDLKNEKDNKYYIKPSNSYIKWVRATGKHTFKMEDYVKLKRSGSRALFKYLSHLDNNTYTKQANKPYERDLAFFYEDILGGHKNCKVSDKFATLKEYLDEIKTRTHIEDYNFINIPGKPGVYKVQIFFFDRYEKMLPEYKSKHLSEDPHIEEKEAAYQQRLKDEINQNRELHDLITTIMEENKTISNVAFPETLNDYIAINKAKKEKGEPLRDHQAFKFNSFSIT